MEASLNEKILARESADIGVEIEPEPTYLISKDTNNRIEMDPKTGEVQAASGGTLGCRSWAGKKGPSPSKNLAHPAIIDWALCEYLVFAATDKSGRTGLDKPFNPEVGLNILKSAQNKMDKIRLLNMFQNIVASSIGSIRYNFASKPGQPDQPIILQHYNRVFIVKDGTPGAVHLAAAVARKLTPVQIKNRKKNNERMYQHDPMAGDILTANGVPTNKLPEFYEASITKITNIEDDWFMLIDNRALQFIPDAEVDMILENLDYGKYLYLLGNSFEKSWRNILPHSQPRTDMAPFTKDLAKAMMDFKSGNTGTTANTKAPAGTAIKTNVITPDDSQSNTQAQASQVEINLPDDAQAAPASEIDTAVAEALELQAETVPGQQVLPWEENQSEQRQDTKPDMSGIINTLSDMLGDCDNIMAEIANIADGSNLGLYIKCIQDSVREAIEEITAASETSEK